MNHTYKPSGIAPLSSIIKTILIGISFSIVLPLIYVILNRLIPNIWFAGLSAILFGICLGYSINWGVKIGKIRNVKIATSIAIFCGLLAFYMQWVIYDELMYSSTGFTFDLSLDDIKILLKNIFFLFTHPTALWNEIANLNQIGTFSIEKGDPFTGLMLWIVWILEFLIIMISVLLYVIKGTVSEPYSEVDDCWMKKREATIIAFVTDKNELISDFDRGNFQHLEDNLDINNEPLEEFAQLTVYESDRDPLKFISINNIKVKKKKNGKDELISNNIIQYYPVLNTIYKL